MLNIKGWFKGFSPKLSVPTLGFGHKKTGRIINIWEHEGWGDSLYFSDYQKGRIVGWLQDKPEVGDEIRSKMKSGKVGRFSVVSVENCENPHDMFFATVDGIDFLEGEPKSESEMYPNESKKDDFRFLG